MIGNGMYTLRNAAPDGWRTVSYKRAFERLEPDDGKLSRPVLRGLEGSNALRLPGVRNNPLRYTDPSGHNPACGPDGVYCGGGQWVRPVLSKGVCSINDMGSWYIAFIVSYTQWISWK
jgi:hypothetical protein